MSKRHPLPTMREVLHRYASVDEIYSGYYHWSKVFLAMTKWAEIQGEEAYLMHIPTYGSQSLRRTLGKNKF